MELEDNLPSKSARACCSRNNRGRSFLRSTNCRAAVNDVKRSLGVACTSSWWRRSSSAALLSLEVFVTKRYGKLASFNLSTMPPLLTTPDSQPMIACVRNYNFPLFSIHVLSLIVETKLTFLFATNSWSINRLTSLWPEDTFHQEPSYL